MRKIPYYFIIFCLLIPFVACKKEQIAIKKPVAEQVRPPTVTQEAGHTEEAKKATQEAYSYDSRGKRDPFLSLVMMFKQKPERKKGTNNPFASYSVDELNLLAIAWDDQKYYALIMLPDKKSYTITEGMKLGLYGGDGGTVQKITKDMVIIRENVKDYRGEIKPKDSILKLGKEGGG